MEAQYLTNENGENVGVYLDMEQYRAAVEARMELDRVRREVAENERELEFLEGALLEFIDRVKEEGAYEHFVEHVEEQFLARGDSPERARRLTDLIEDVEARHALRVDIEQGDDDFVPWEEVEKSVDAARATSG